MNIHFREEDFVPFLDARLEPGERARLDRHRAECADCRARLEELRAVLLTLDDWRAAEPSPAFAAALRARLADEPALSWWEALTMRPAFGAALGVAVVAALVVVTNFPAMLPSEQETSVAITQPPVTPAPAATASDNLAELDTKVLLEDYELLAEFDELFEATPKKEKKL